MRNDSTERNPLWVKTEVQRYPILVTEPAVRPSEGLLNKLRMQNEELRHTHAALEESRDRYAALYDFASIGYLTLMHNGLIAKSNPTVAGLLGLHRKKLLHHYFAAFITAEDGDRWYLFFSDV